MPLSLNPKNREGKCKSFACLLEKIPSLNFFETASTKVSPDASHILHVPNFSQEVQNVAFSCEIFPHFEKKYPTKELWGDTFYSKKSEVF